jgi:hypothetical protein
MKRLLLLLPILILLAACNTDQTDDATTIIEPTTTIEVTTAGGIDSADPSAVPLTATVAEVPTLTTAESAARGEAGRPGFSATINNASRLSIDDGRYRWALDSRHYLQDDSADNIEYSLLLSDDETAYTLRLGLSDTATGAYQFLEYTPDTEGAFVSVTVPQGNGETIIYEQFPNGDIELTNDGLFLSGRFEFDVSTAVDPGDAPEIIRVSGSFQNMPVTE